MKEQYTYKKMLEMEQILKALELPAKLSNKLCVLSLLAAAKLEEKTKWSKASEEYMRIHDIIVFINTAYPGKGGTDKNIDPTKRDYKDGTRESVRKHVATPFCEMAIMEHNGETATNSMNNMYRLTKEFARLIKTYGSTEWEDALKFYKKTHKTYEEKYSQIKKIDKGMSVKFKEEEFALTRSPHNKLQKEILEDFVPNFAPGSELLYIGDTKKKELIINRERLAELKIKVIDNAKLPDIILYERTYNWIIFVEAYTSTGEITIERKKKLLEYCSECDKSIEIIFVTAFSTMNKCKEKLLTIAWDTEIWISEEPTHMIHKNGDKFIGGHQK